MITLYLSAIVLANLLVAITQTYAPSLLTPVTLFNAGAFIALDLTARDTLHERWAGQVWRNMAALILTGSTVSAVTVILFNLLFGQAVSVSAPVASFVAFAGAGAADTAIYAALRRRPRWVKINGSNAVSALVDSLLFPLLAFVVLAPVLPLTAALEISIYQFIVKFGCGVIWSIVLSRRWAARLRTTL